MRERRAGRAVAAVSGVAGRVFAPIRRAVHAAVSGDKPLVVALLAVIALSVVLLSGPTQNYLDHRDRVGVLQMQADVLEAENARLAARAEDLHDDETIELLAREQQGFIRPGEVPYALVPPQVDRPRITAPREEPQREPAPWYGWAWAALQDLLGG
jgi:cell division protein FtsB